MLKKIASLVGPGVITASLVLGPGSVTVATLSGAMFGYDLLFALVILWAFMCAYTFMAAKVGVLSDKTLLTLVAGQFGRPVAVLLGASVFLTCCFFQTGDVIGVSTSLGTVFNMSDTPFKIGFPLLCLALYFFSPNIYVYVERIMLAMILMMLVSFLANLFMAGFDVAAMAKGFVPKLPTGPQLGLLTAMSATNFVVAAAFYQSYLVKEKGWTKENYRKMMKDTLLGITLLFVLVGIITITSAAVLHPRGITVRTAGDMAVQLEPLLGPFAKYLFCCGLFAASFSSLAVNALTGATLLSDGLGKSCRMGAGCVKGFAATIMLFGLVMSLVLGGTPVKAITFLQKLTLLTVPLLAVTLIVVANRRAVLGEHKNGPALNVLTGLGFLLILYLFYNLLKSFLA
ncbi:MAG: divalent metal cation transporter [Fibrobacterota bacterium]